MTTPYLQREAERLGILRKEPDMSWMHNALFETPNPIAEARRARRLYTIIAVSITALIAGFIIMDRIAAVCQFARVCS